MKKNKNKKIKPAKKTSLLSGAAKSLKKLRKSNGGLRGLSTTQKVVGGALVALGLGYLAKRRNATPATPDATAAEDTLASMDETQAAPTGRGSKAAS